MKLRKSIGLAVLSAFTVSVIPCRVQMDEETGLAPAEATEEEMTGEGPATEA